MNLQSIYPAYFNLTINQRINARSKRNALNITGLIRATIYAVGAGYITSQDAASPAINNNAYHKAGKNHTAYSYTHITTK